MNENKPRENGPMGPPRLTLVPRDGERPASAAAPSSDLPPPFTDPDSEPTGSNLETAANSDAVEDAAAGPAHADQTGVVEAPSQSAPNAQSGDPVGRLAVQEHQRKLRMIEAILFAAPEPLAEAEIGAGLIEVEDLAVLLAELQEIYATRGVNLVKVAGKWAFRTAEDLSFLLQRYAREERRLSRAALETMAIIAYHQPVTRAEIEEIRGVTTSAGTIDILLETGWIRPRGRRRAPGRPVTYGTTESFLGHFGLDSVRDLPGLSELKGLGLLDATLPPGFTVPDPRDVAALMPDELPLEDATEADAQGALAFEDDEAREATGDDDAEAGADLKDTADVTVAATTAVPLVDPGTDGQSGAATDDAAMDDAAPDDDTATDESH